MTCHTVRAALLLGTTVSFVVCYAVATQSVDLGSHEGGWVYPYVRPIALESLAMFVVTSLAAGLLLAVPEGFARRHEWLVVILWLLVGLTVQALLRSLTPFTLERMFVSDIANGFYGVSRRFTAVTALGDFNSVRDYWPLHAQSNMPGKLMFVYALKNISRRPDLLAWLVVAVSNLGGVLLYLFVRDLFADRQAALFSLVLYLFVPAKLFFFPLLNTVTPVVVLVCACLLLRWTLTGRAAYAAFLGIALYGLVFYEPLGLVMGLLFAVLIVRAVRRGDLTWRTLLLHGGLALLGFAATHAVMLVRFRFDLFETLRVIGAHALAFNVEAARPYSVWVRQNLLDFAFGAGVCQAVLFCIILGAGFLRAGSPGRLTEPITLLCVALAATLLVTDLLGVNRGEVVRLWIFLACFFQIPTAYACARLNSRPATALGFGVVMATTLLQGALGTSMIGFILP